MARRGVNRKKHIYNLQPEHIFELKSSQKSLNWLGHLDLYLGRGNLFKKESKHVRE